MASNLRVDTILPSSGTTLGIGTASGTINFLGNSNLTTTGDVTVGGNLGVGGTLTYEDVTNIDSVGVITARSGINVSSGSIGINTTGGNEKLNAFGAIRSSGSSANFNAGLEGTLLDYDIANRVSRVGHVNGASGSARSLAFLTGGGERLRVGPAGQLGIGGANYGTSGQVLTSKGASSSVQWVSVSQPDLMADTWRLVTQFINAQTTLGSGGSDWERDDTYGNGLLGTGAASAGMSVSNGYFSFPTTGFYSVKFYGHHSMSYSDGRAISGYIVYTANNFSSSEYATYYTVNCIGNTGQIIHGSSSCEKIFDITDVSNQKFKLAVTYAQNATGGRTTVDTNANRTYVIVTRLGDT